LIDTFSVQHIWSWWKENCL